VFSLIESDTELINRSKRPKPVVFDYWVPIVENRAGFILYSQKMSMNLFDKK
jgi:hypothetical protein